MPSQEDLSFARQVVAQGICQRAEVEECLTQQHRDEQAGLAPKLAELLIGRGFLTRSQLERFAKTGFLPTPDATRVGHYELLLKIGEGGMGAVYKARDTRNGQIVALKILPRSKASDEVFLKRFELEARAAFELNHPNIVRGFDVGHADGYHFLVMEFVQGYDVCALLEQHGRLSEAETLNIVEQMAKALDHIASEHLVHRDIKPENILVTAENVAKLTDMGLTVADATHGRRKRLTEAGIAMGTPFYLSPEQIKGEGEIDIRSDIYALGATTYEMITGRPPFDGETPALVMMKHLNEQVPSPHDLDRTVSIHFCHLLERMMAKDPFHRYQSPYELLQDVRRVMKGKPPLGIRPPAGRSSVARPVMHGESQRVTKHSSAHAVPVKPQGGSEKAKSSLSDAVKDAPRNPGSGIRAVTKDTSRSLNSVSENSTRQQNKEGARTSAALKVSKPPSSLAASLLYFALGAGAAGAAAALYFWVLK